MHLPHYDYIDEQAACEFSFVSEGTKGQIQKRVVYTPLPQNPEVINLAFGDIDQESGELSDTVNSNNGDRKKVLVTVAQTIHEYCNQYGNHYITASGSTPSRTRLYQMEISALQEEIEAEFNLWGLNQNQWQPFRKGINYEAFLVKRK